MYFTVATSIALSKITKKIKLKLKLIKSQSNKRPYATWMIEDTVCIRVSTRRMAAAMVEAILQGVLK